VNVFRIEITDRQPDGSPSHEQTGLIDELRDAGLPSVRAVQSSRLFFVEGELAWREVQQIATQLLADPVTERYHIAQTSDKIPSPISGLAFEVHLRLGVMDPVAETTLAELRSEGFAVHAVRTARRYIVDGEPDAERVAEALRRVLVNDCIEELVIGAAPVAPAPRPQPATFRRREVPICSLDEAGLEQLSRTGHLFLSGEELSAIQQYYRGLGRDPTDLELETFAQTWSEHCFHKTLRSTVVYRGSPLPEQPGLPRSTSSGATVVLRYANLLRDTIVRATEELMAAGRGPECLSVFQDNAGVVAFDDHYGLAFKVETHNHPSAIEPYGGAATGLGGCIRDILGCGLAARPIANTDVFCIAPTDWPHEQLPRGVLHPRRVLRGVVRGVADYGNRMGIPTVNGAVYFDPRYLGNPLVYCGCLGLIPRDRVTKGARPGDRIVLIGGRTGRDGIHGATFSSAELSDGHAGEFSHAVQIGNAITEKRVLDAVLRARDDAAGCLYSAITDCGAGGLSSAVGEMAARVGAVVDLDDVPLKYAGLRYDEIWISEAQERMVLAVPPEQLERLLDIMRQEEVEATVIGTFGPPGGEAEPLPETQAGLPPGVNPPPHSAPRRLLVRFQGVIVGDLDLDFLYRGPPQRERPAEWQPASPRPSSPADASSVRSEAAGASRVRPDLIDELLGRLASPNIASRAWIIRQYDHEVQGGSVVKPLAGPGGGPNDAAVLRPRLDSQRGVAIGCGLAPHLNDVDPYWMAVSAIDEAVRNVVAVGGDPSRTALLDNFCWGRTDDPRELGALVRACQGCHDAAVVYGTPFISGKDSLNNEFSLDPGDVDDLIEVLSRRASGDNRTYGGLKVCRDAIERRLRQTGRLCIPGTLLISAIALVEDVRRCVTAYLKEPDARLYLVGGLPPLNLTLVLAARIHDAVAAAIRAGLVRACHDVSEGGWLVALAEMAVGGALGVALEVETATLSGAFEELASGYVVESHSPQLLEAHFAGREVPCRPLGRVLGEPVLAAAGRSVPLASLRAAWSSGAEPRPSPGRQRGR
jgi:phosphoribosylformylglycinamidine synthase